jgi:hypothetical protein
MKQSSNGLCQSLGLYLQRSVRASFVAQASRLCELQHRRDACATNMRLGRVSKSIVAREGDPCLTVTASGEP